MLNINLHGLVGNNIQFNDVEKELKIPTDKRILAIVEALKRNISIDKIHDLTKIDRWFLHKLKNVVETEKELSQYDISSVPKELLKQAKQQGFSDFQIAKIIFRNDGNEM